MNAVPPSCATVSTFSLLKYPLSPLTSRIVKPLAAVALTNGQNCGLSAASLSRMRTEVTTLVRTPQAACALTQRHFRRLQPYLWSYHVSKRLLEKPVESTA